MQTGFSKIRPITKETDHSGSLSHCFVSPRPAHFLPLPAAALGGLEGGGGLCNSYRTDRALDASGPSWR